MRQNLPVTQNEYPIPDGSAIISHTDLKGHITFCNEEFVVASGFSRPEVIGQPHNILRHPDMPPEAYRDMWATLERGLPWSGIVKNRRKNGDFYWVKATATPLADRSGYMSVRVKASRTEIAAADALYARMRADAGIRLEQGQLAPTGLAAALGKLLPHPSLKARIHLICGGLTVLTVIVAAAGLNATDHAREALSVAVTDETAIIRQLALPPDDPLRASLQRHVSASQDALQRIEAENTATRQWIIGLSLSGLLLAGIATLQLIRRLGHSVDAGKRVAEAIAKGNMLEPLPPASNDELGALIIHLAVMRNNLHELVASIRNQVNALMSNARELSGTASDTRVLADAQAESASGMAAAIEQLSVSIDHISEHARESRELSETSGERAATGSRVIGHAVSEMRAIADSVNLTAQSVRNLESLSGEISMIVGVIREIADQTNLLALNAAIEAARAGESGRGFAVVADEVRKLAERTANSTAEITTMIERIQSATRSAADDMDEGVKGAARGVTLADEAGSTIGSIQESSTQVLGSVEGITLGLTEQSAAARDIAQRVEQIAGASESNAASAARITQSAQQLEELARALEALSSRFRIA